MRCPARRRPKCTKPWIKSITLTWSPDGCKIAFVASSNIYVMNADGTDRVQLTKSNDISFIGIDWSGDGSKLIFVSNRDGDDDIYVATTVIL